MLIAAARIAESRIPAINGGNSSRTRRINTVSLAPSISSGITTLPITAITTAAASVMTTQTEATIREVFIIELFFIDMKRTIM